MKILQEIWDELKMIRVYHFALEELFASGERSAEARLASISWIV